MHKVHARQRSGSSPTTTTTGTPSHRSHTHAGAFVQRIHMADEGYPEGLIPDPGFPGEILIAGLLPRCNVAIFVRKSSNTPPLTWLAAVILNTAYPGQAILHQIRFFYKTPTCIKPCVYVQDGNKEKAAAYRKTEQQKGRSYVWQQDIGGQSDQMGVQYIGRNHNM